jgi:hypothetical protein
LYRLSNSFPSSGGILFRNLKQKIGRSRRMGKRKNARFPHSCSFARARQQVTPRKTNKWCLRLWKTLVFSLVFRFPFAIAGGPPAPRHPIRVPPAFQCPRSGFHGFQCWHPSRVPPSSLQPPWRTLRTLREPFFPRQPSRRGRMPPLRKSREASSKLPRRAAGGGQWKSFS